jgi:hypothetical protein
MDSGLATSSRPGMTGKAKNKNAPAVPGRFSYRHDRPINPF